MLTIHNQIKLVVAYHVSKNLTLTEISLQNGDLMGTGDGQFIDPEHLAIDSEGYVYVSDKGNNNIQVFKPIDNVPHNNK